MNRNTAADQTSVTALRYDSYAFFSAIGHNLGNLFGRSWLQHQFRVARILLPFNEESQYGTTSSERESAITSSPDYRLTARLR